PDAGLVGDPRQLEQDPRHVGGARHRDREPEDVGDRDRLRIVLCRRRREGVAELERGGRDLFVEAGRRGRLRADHHEVAGRGIDEDDGADDHTERARGQLPLSEGGTWASAGTGGAGAALGGRTSARIVNWTSSRSFSSWLWLDCSRTLARSGITESRERNRATPFCEYVAPVSVKPVPAAAACAGSGAAAESFVSQTSSGSTSETCRSTRSHATRPASAAESAP